MNSYHHRFFKSFAKFYANNLYIYLLSFVYSLQTYSHSCPRLYYWLNGILAQSARKKSTQKFHHIFADIMGTIQKT